MSDSLKILQGDALEQLRTLPDESVQMGVTSPPYFNLRDYSACDCRKHRIQHDSSTMAGSQAGTPNHIGPPNPNCQKCNGTGKITGTEKQLGLESKPEQFIDSLVEIFREFRRV